MSVDVIVSDLFLLLQQFGWAALHFASYEGHTDIVVALVDNGADIDAVTTKVI